VRLPRALLEEAGLGEDVVLRASPGRIVIESARAPRAGWAEAAKAMHAAGEDQLLDAPTATRFEAEDREWGRTRPNMTRLEVLPP
jgi:antitoxin MazE